MKQAQEELTGWGKLMQELEEKSYRRSHGETISSRIGIPEGIFANLIQCAEAEGRHELVRAALEYMEEA